MSRLSRGAEKWTPARVLIDREGVARALNRPVRRVGNPVIGRDQVGALRLFFVSTSIGGWATSSVNFMVSIDDGATWSAPRRLVTSPFLNISTLVKGAPVAYADGTLGLPVYHEFLGKFGELLRFRPDGSVVAKARMTWGRRAIQPALVALGPRRAVAFFRDSRFGNGRVLIARSASGGRHWTSISASRLPNPDSAVSAVRIGQTQVALVFNDSATKRSRLRLTITRDGGRSFDRMVSIEAADSKSAAYPHLLCASDGRIHVVYAFEYREIRHAVLGGGRTGGL